MAKGPGVRGACYRTGTLRPDGTPINRYRFRQHEAAIRRHRKPMNASTPPLAIVHNQAQHRFEAVLPEGLCRADYRRVGDTMHLVHSEVPWELEGRGIAGELVQAALDYAAAKGLKVIPQCSYVRAYMRRHPDTHHLLAPGARV
jgi:predicted GNAT family acetyltransferase